MVAFLRPGLWRRMAPGGAASFLIAAAAPILSAHYGAPVMLFALLLGLALNFIGEDKTCRPGIDLTARTLLRIGVALLGLRITAGDIAALGPGPVLLVVGTVAATIGFSVLLAHAMGFNRLFGLLSGGATAICGASAALALSAALPAHPLKERATSFTIIGVSALSTLAMIAYPAVAWLVGLDSTEAGMFIGGTIHDVAQVVGAGYSMSHETGDTATVVKLLRVAMLLPVILAAAMITRARGGHESGQRPPLLPWFAVAFFGCAVLTSLGAIPPALQKAGTDLSTWCLVTAIAALGMKIQLKELTTVGLKPVLLMLGQTVFLAAWVLGLLWLGA